MTAAREARGGGAGWRLAMLACLAGYLVWNALYYFPYLVDDAFISLRYARNLALGEGLVYNPGERVEGFSNFSWVLVAAALKVFGWPLVTCLKVLGLGCAVGMLLGTYGLGRRVFAGDERGSAKVLLACGLLGLNTSLALWSQAGLETTLFGCLLVLACWRFELELACECARPVSAVLFGLAWMTRPEAPAYLAYFVLRRLCVRRAFERRDGVWLAVCAALVVPYEVFGLVYYGRLLPATQAAKPGAGRAWSALVAGRVENAILFKFVREQGLGFLVLCLTGLAGALVRARRTPLAVWAPALAGIVFVLYAWTDWMPRYRLLVPALPFVFLLVAHGSLELASLARRLPYGGLAGLPGLLGLLVPGAAFVDYARHQCFDGYGNQQTHFDAASAYALSARGSWMTEVPGRLSERLYPLEGDAWLMLELASEGEVVAIPDIGFPGFVGGNPIWDVRGLVTPAAARARHDPDEAVQRAMLDDLLAARPAYIALPLRGDNASKLIGEFDEKLRGDERIEALYERRELPGKLLYLRRDAQRPDVAERLKEALARFPEYRSERVTRALAGEH